MTTTTPSKEVFRLKPEPAGTERSIDELIDEAKELQGAKAKLQERIDALKAPVRAHMEAKELRKYIAPSGVTATLACSNKTKPNAKLGQELLDGDTYLKVFPKKESWSFSIK